MVRYGFADFLKHLNLPSSWVSKVVSDKDGRIEKMTMPQRIRYALRGSWTYLCENRPDLKLETRFAGPSHRR